MSEEDMIEVETGSGNVFADLGLPDADAHLLKAQLVSGIDAIIRRRKLTVRPKPPSCWGFPSRTSPACYAVTSATSPSRGSSGSSWPLTAT